ncbi:hypothetical protein DR996_17305 [Vibrio owensii]|nr:hypothetical protein DR996_17305 [Vibrio owensii]
MEKIRKYEKRSCLFRLFRCCDAERYYFRVFNLEFLVERSALFKNAILEVDRNSQNDITMLVALEFAELAEQRDYDAILNRACVQLDLVSGRLDFSKSQESLIVQERLKERDTKAIETVKRLKDLGYCQPKA